MTSNMRFSTRNDVSAVMLSDMHYRITNMFVFGVRVYIDSQYQPCTLDVW